jgi:uncharacterized pyridoxamine 5'-phosphate oxidase family protein
MEMSWKRSSSFTRTIIPKTMTAQEVIDFINVTRNGIVATIRKDGSPHTAWNPVAYVEDKLYTYADPNSVCYRNLHRDGRVSVAIALGSKAVFVEGEAKEVGQVSKMIDTLLAKILSEVKDWIPKSSVTYVSLAECQASIFEIKITKILSYKGG